MKVLLFSLLATLTAANLSAQPSPGSNYTYAIPSPIYDLTGPQSGSDDYVVVTAQVFHLANGRLTGQADACYNSFEVGSDFCEISAAGPVSGKVGNAGAKVTARFTFQAAISDTDLWGDPIRGSYRLAGQTFLNTQTGDFQGTASSRACISGRGCATASGDFVLNPSADQCSLILTNLQLVGRTITGQAVVQMLGTGRTFDYTLRGTLNAKTKVSTIKLKGIGAGTGSSFALRAGNGFEVQRLTGRLLGQTVKFPTP